MKARHAKKVLKNLKRLNIRDGDVLFVGVPSEASSYVMEDMSILSESLSECLDVPVVLLSDDCTLSAISEAAVEEAIRRPKEEVKDFRPMP